MNKQAAKDRIDKLAKLINRYRYAYHALDKPEISDEALDSLKKELFDLEAHYPELITPDSPTQRVAGKPLAKFIKYAHASPMLSFNDAFSIQDMNDWLDRIKRLLSADEIAQIDFFANPSLTVWPLSWFMKTVCSKLAPRGATAALAKMSPKI
jgi:NAD-dependent DNA ligase (contains BRCT domain type II)